MYVFIHRQMSSLFWRCWSFVSTIYFLVSPYDKQNLNEFTVSCLWWKRSELDLTGMPQSWASVSTGLVTFCVLQLLHLIWMHFGCCWAILITNVKLYPQWQSAPSFTMQNTKPKTVISMLIFSAVTNLRVIVITLAHSTQCNLFW